MVYAMSNRSGVMTARSAGPTRAAPARLDLVAPAHDVTLDRRGQAGRDGERERVPAPVGVAADRLRLAPERVGVPERRLAMVAEPEVRAPRLLAARDHVHRAGVAVVAHVDAALDPAAALEQRVGQLDVEVAGRERGDHAIEEVGRLVQRRLAARISTGSTTCERRRPETGLRARTAKPSRQLGPAAAGGVSGDTAQSNRAAPVRGARRGTSRPRSRACPAGHTSIRSRVTSAGAGRARAARPRIGSPAVAVRGRQIELERAAGRAISVASQQERSPTGDDPDGSRHDVPGGVITPTMCKHVVTENM